MNNDILKQLEAMRQSPPHDPAWLAQDEEALRAHMKLHPIRPPSMRIPWVAIIALALLAAGILLVASPKINRTSPLVTPTEAPLESPTKATATPAGTLTTPVPRGQDREVLRSPRLP